MAVVQTGTTLKVAFGSFAYTGYIPEDGLSWSKPAGNQVDVTDEAGDMETKIIMDPSDAFTMDLIIKDTGGSVTPPKQGATVTITDPSGASQPCFVNSASVAFNRSYSVLTLDLVNEGSMTYS